MDQLLREANYLSGKSFAGVVTIGEKLAKSLSKQIESKQTNAQAVKQ